MNDSTRPHRLEELESKVEKIMNMMSQLLETKSTCGGQQKEEEEPGGTGRGAAYNYSGGAGRASATADTGYGVTAIRDAAGAEVPVHSRVTASEPTRPARQETRRLSWRGPKGQHLQRGS